MTYSETLKYLSELPLSARPPISKPVDSERLDLPSASDAYPRRRCLGRYQLIRHLKETGKLTPRPADQDATFGTRVHAAWAGEPIELSVFEAQTLEKMQRLEAMLVTDWAAGRAVALLAREQRLWLHSGITPLHSGRYDCAYATANWKAMLFIDGKTLMEPVAPADTNDQLRELVALAHWNYPSVEEFTVAILQPNVERPVSMATYDQLESELALRLLRWHLDDIQGRDLPRIYGDWCRHCPALEFCPEAKAGIEPVLAHQFATQDDKLVLTTGLEGADFLRRLVRAKHLIETLLASYKAFLEQNPDEIPGWSLKAGKSKRTLTDVRAVYEVLAGTVSLEDFLACTSVSVTKLEHAFGKSLGLKAKALKDTFNARLEAVIDWKTDAPQLEDSQ
jgi:hypothetical protein